MQIKRGKQENGKDLRSPQENWRYKGTIDAKMGRIKNRYGEDLTEAKEIKKNWQEYTEKLYKKDLKDLDNHDVWSLT